MKYLKSNLYLILIFSLAVFLRLNYDIFVFGYNFDEIAIMGAASQDFPFGILKYASEADYHAPLYQMIAHFFTYFNQEWFYLRIFNILVSLFNVYIFYKIGCLLKNKATGYIMALLICTNHLEITTVSFIKFYCLGFCLFSWSLYYFIKILKKDQGYNKFAILNIFFILLSTHAFIYIGLEYFLLLIIKKDKIKVVKSGLLSFVGFLLYCPVLIKQIMLNHENIFSPHSSYVEFSFWSLYNMFNDHLGPLLNYCCNNITVESFGLLLHFIQSINERSIEWHYLIEFVLFSFNVILISFYLLIKGVLKNKIARYLTVVNFCYLFIYFIITKLQLTGLIPIYLFAFALNLLVCVGIGLMESDRKISCALFVYLIIANLFVTNCYPPSKRGTQKGKPFYMYEQYYKIHPNARIIATEGARFLKGYYRDKDIIDFDSEKMSGLNGRKIVRLIYGEKIDKINKKNAKDIIAPLILNNYRSPEFEEYFKKNIADNFRTGEEIILAFDSNSGLSFLANMEECKKALRERNYKSILGKGTIEQGLKDTADYMDTSELADIIRTYSYEYLFDLLDKYFEQTKFEQYTQEPFSRFKKVYEDNTNKYSAKWLAKNTISSWIFITYKKR